MKTAAMPAPYRAMGERLHSLLMRSAPALQPTVWYAMPGYAKDGKTICFFRADKKNMTFGFPARHCKNVDSRYSDKKSLRARFGAPVGRASPPQGVRPRLRRATLHCCPLGLVIPGVGRTG